MSHKTVKTPLSWKTALIVLIVSLGSTLQVWGAGMAAVDGVDAADDLINHFS